MIDTITTHQHLPIRSSQTYPPALINLYYFFQIVKEHKQPMIVKRSNHNRRTGFCRQRLRFDVWWRLTGSNRRPPACKAGALPAELNPQVTCKALLDGGSGWARTNDPRVIN